MKTHQTGLTLTELMIGIAISAFLSLVAVTTFVGTIRLSNDATGIAGRESQFAMVSEMISSSLRRAGYRGAASNAANHWANTTGGTEGAMPAVEIFDGGSCFVTSSAVADGGDYAMRQFGIKLDGNVVKVLSDTTVACDTGTWEPVTDTNAQYFHVLNVALADETILDGDTGAEITLSETPDGNAWELANCGTASSAQGDSSEDEGSSGNSGNSGSDNEDSSSSDSEDSSSTASDAGGAVSCRIKQLYRVTLCASNEAEAGDCISAPENEPFYAQWLVTPRNEIIIARSYRSYEQNDECSDTDSDDQSSCEADSSSSESEDSTEIDDS